MRVVSRLFSRIKLAITLSSMVLADVQASSPPNIVIIFADDLGYGDLGCYGAAPTQSPHLDGMARDGVKFTDFYVAQAVCSASRAALLTGCYSNRVGIHGALGPTSRIGIADSETTLPEILKSAGYATAAVGKWHLGHLPQFLPTLHGFDEYFGLPYSNDMWPYHPEARKGTYPPLPLLDGIKVVDAEVSPADQQTLTQRYTERAVDFIKRSKSQPFFLYLAHSMPHVPLFVSEKYKGISKRGQYADVIREIDSSVGHVLNAIESIGATRNTLVIFTSDNGPWLSYGNHGGSAGPLREGKGTAWEGGVRVPFLARWPGTIPAGSVQRSPAMTIDLLPTLTRLAGGKLPSTTIDGHDIWPLLSSQPGVKPTQYPYYFYYKTNELHAIRLGNMKLVLPHSYRTMNGQPPGKDGIPGKYRQEKLRKPELYDLDKDPGEQNNLAEKKPQDVEQLLVLVDSIRGDLGDSLTGRPGPGRRAPGKVE